MARRLGGLKARERRLRAMASPRRRRRLPGLPGPKGLLLLALSLLAIGGAAALYWFGLRTTTVAPQLRPPRLVASIGFGPEAVAVGPDGAILRFLPPPEEGSLPQLPIATPPEKPQIAGTLLDQVRVLAAAPPALRPHLQSTRYGMNGVEVELGSGIELRFGDASQAAAKWQAAAAVLANPSVTVLDYVDLRAPGHPAVGGSGHALPPPP